MAVTRGLIPSYIVNSSSEFATTWEQGAVMYALNETQQRILNGTELFPAGYGNAIGQISAGTTNQSSGTVVFSNSNGVTFGMNGGTITASVGAAAGIAAVSGGTTQMTSGTAVFSNSNGVSFGVDGNTLTASVAAIKSISAGTTRGTNGEVVFSNSNGVSFGIDGNTITASVLGGAAGSISAGTTRATLGEVIFSNSNGISFGMDAGTVTASYTVPTQSAQTVGLYALGNTTQNSSTTLDARSLSINGLGIVTAGYSNGSIQISASQSTVAQNASLYGLGNTTQNSSTVLSVNALSFNGLGAMSVGYSNGSIQMSVPTQTNQNISLYALGNTTQNSSTVLNASVLSFNGLGAATVGYSNGSIQMSVPVQTNQSLGLYAVSNTTQNSSTTLDARSLSFQGAGVASVGYSNGSVVISVSAQTAAAAPVNISAGTTSNNLATIVFSDSNGVSFGLNGSTITGSVATSLTNINYSAGTTSNNLSNIVYSNSNGVSFGLNGSTITASVAKQENGFWDNIMANGNTVSGGIGSFAFTNSHRSLFVFPLQGQNQIFPFNISAKTIHMNASVSGSTATASVAYTSHFYLGIYTLNGSTLSLLNSGSVSMGTGANNANLSNINAGQRFVPILSSAFSVQPVFSQGVKYYMAYFWSSAGILNQTGNLLGGFRYSTVQRSGSWGVSQTTGTSMGWSPFYGIYTATTSALPTAIQNSELNKVNAAAGFVPHIVINADLTASF